MNRKQRGAAGEEAEYVNRAVRPVATASGQSFRSFTWVFLPAAGCWVILVIIMALRIHFTSVISENNAMLTEENQQLRTQRSSLLEKIKEMEAKRDELNISRAQWSVDQYCPAKDGVRRCEPCQRDWVQFRSSCLGFFILEDTYWRSWDEAQATCNSLNSDLVVLGDEGLKTFVNNYSLDSSGASGYWVGLRVEDGKWKWVDGSDPTADSWMQPSPPAEGHCAIAVHNEGLKSVNCGAKNRWICQKKALTL